MKRAWIYRRAMDAIIAEADAAYSDETGGVFVGYWSTGEQEAVITEIIGPGPNAEHRPYGFIPDYSYQEIGIAAAYEQSGRRHTYLGDWHTHPDSKQTRLSWRDRQTLRRIASHVDARVKTPLMAVFAGTPQDWITTIWLAQPRPFGTWLFGPKAVPLAIQIWED